MPPVDVSEDANRLALIGFTAEHLREARTAALAAEAATIQLGYVALARDLAKGRP